MRLFTAINLSPAVRSAIERLLGELRPAAELSWSPVANLHVTTKFIGELAEDKLAEAMAALGEVARPGPIDIELRGLGWFPNPHSPRVFWVGVKAGPALAELAENTNTALARIGVPAEEKPFTPHLTLARIRTPKDLIPLRRKIAGIDPVEFGAWRASEFHLYLSENGKYTKLADFPL